MPVFKYEARERMGKLVHATTEAPSMRHAMRALLSDGYKIVWIKPQSSAMLDNLTPMFKPLGFVAVIAAAIFAALFYRGSLH